MLSNSPLDWPANLTKRKDLCPASNRECWQIKFAAGLLRSQNIRGKSFVIRVNKFLLKKFQSP